MADPGHWAITLNLAQNIRISLSLEIGFSLKIFPFSINFEFPVNSEHFQNTHKRKAFIKQALLSKFLVTAKGGCLGCAGECLGVA